MPSIDGITVPDDLVVPDVPASLTTMAQDINAKINSVRSRIVSLLPGFQYLGSGVNFNSTDGTGHTLWIDTTARYTNWQFTAPSEGHLLIWATCAISPRNSNGVNRAIYLAYAAQHATDVTKSASSVGWSRQRFKDTGDDAVFSLQPFSYTAFAAGETKTFGWFARFLNGAHQANYSLMDARFMYLWLGPEYQSAGDSGTTTNDDGTDDLPVFP